MLDSADGGQAKLLTCIGFDWSQRYWRTIEALRSLKLAYLDGELCALNADGVAVFSRLQAAMDEGRTDQLFFYALSSVPELQEYRSPPTDRA